MKSTSALGAMKSAAALGALALAASVGAFDSAAYSKLLPTAAPTVTTTASQCEHLNLTSMFDVPRPTGVLGTAFKSYAKSLTEDCSTLSLDFEAKFKCSFPEAPAWCGFSRAIPATLLPEYTSFASQGSSWWSNHSTRVYSVASECPGQWYNGGFAPFGALFLNWTVAFGGACGPADVGPLTTVSGARPTATSTPGAPGTGPGGSTAETGAPRSGCLGRMEGLHPAVLILGGLSAAVINSI
ncbi:uncharacterized protein E0L32_004323 [Thyridium curvatum]|uniref:DUF7735 domain-containing protein n=1 Tax=Thyridium curvatum TaxID=1093900 RepID=A0A507AXW7_9PEZI|nr:uncharacterized protein E0L32_004323 [Thyridium curvatum]TPX15625.1 hypothetical protein E0L32_004323 [Thyridium curvatum]